jgi:flagellar protein FliS
MEKHLNIYQKMHVSGLNQKELIVMLYSKALLNIEQAKTAIAANNIQAKHDKLNRARNIFIHLLATLNMDAGGLLAKKLSSLYAYFIEKITMANATKSINELDEIIPLIQEIKEAWEKMEIDEKNMPADKSQGAREPVSAFSAEA